MTLRTSDPGSAAAAARVLLDGGVAIVPTDTVYGIAAHPARPGAVARLYSAKGRADGKPIAMLAASADAVRASGALFTPEADELARRFWPGALTLVLRLGGAFEGFRVPDSPWMRDLLEKCGGLLRVTSANLSGEPDAVRFEDAVRSLGGAADVAVDGGDAPGGTASTVVKAAPGVPVEILRRGPVAV